MSVSAEVVKHLLFFCAFSVADFGDHVTILLFIFFFFSLSAQVPAVWFAAF